MWLCDLFCLNGAVRSNSNDKRFNHCITIQSFFPCNKPYLFFQHFKCVFYLNCLSKTVYFGKTAGAEWFGLCIPMMEFKHERDKTKQFTGGNKCYLLLLLRKQFTSTLNCWRCLFRLHSPFIHLTETLSDRLLARSFSISPTCITFNDM